MATREESDASLKKSAFAPRIGVGLITLSCLLYAGLLVLPFLPLSLRSKLALSSILVITGEAAFWIGGLIVGKEVVTRYKQYLNPRRWLPCRPPDPGSKQR